MVEVFCAVRDPPRRNPLRKPLTEREKPANPLDLGASLLAAVLVPKRSSVKRNQPVVVGSFAAPSRTHKR